MGVFGRPGKVSPSRVSGPGAAWDHATHDAFLEYYAAESQRDETIERFVSLRGVVLRALACGPEPLDVADLGCGAGTQSMVWSQLGHRAHGLDISEQLVALGRERADRAGLKIDFQVGTVTDLPWADESMDVCLSIQLLEHVADWRRCLDESTRVLRRGGALFLTTTNWLCPTQEEFDLPLYSWYPGRLKRRYEHLARTSRPELASYATYPAVNWFSFYGLRRELRQRGCDCRDRFDLIDGARKSGAKRLALSAVRRFPPARMLAHMTTASTWILAVKT
jgi:2-polyprenyl-3-methyl-5-hydroxy-6-metoxy-1,4-benzoquinol methylase